MFVKFRIAVVSCFNSDIESSVWLFAKYSVIKTMKCNLKMSAQTKYVA